jgi:hypothetical protein
MNNKSIITLFLITLAILFGVPGSFARPQYVTNLTAVYGGGSCNTCHIMTQGMRNFNGTFGNPNGTYEPRNNRPPGQRNRTNGTRNFNRTSGMGTSNRTFPRNSYGTLFESQPNHATYPSAALKAIGSPPEAAIQDTPAGTKAAPGFEIVGGLLGLVFYALVAGRHNK